MAGVLGRAVADMSMEDFQVFKLLFPRMYNKRLRLPDKFVQELRDNWDLRMQLAGAGMPVWDVKVLADDKDGSMYLAGDWKEFARAHDLRAAYLLVFRYNRGAATLSVTVFDQSTCCKQYMHAGTAATGSAPVQVNKCIVKKGSTSVTYYKDAKGRWCSPPGIKKITTNKKKCGVKRGAKSVTGGSATAKVVEEVRCPYTHSKRRRPTPIDS